MTGQELPDDDHVVRYVKPTSIRTDGKVAGSAFCLRAQRPDDTGLSVNWLECFRGRTKDQQVAEVMKLRGHFGCRQGAMTSSGGHHARKSNAADGQKDPQIRKRICETPH